MLEMSAYFEVVLHPTEPVVSVVNIGWAAVAWSAEAKGGQKSKTAMVVVRRSG